MKLVSYNINGIRASFKLGLLEFINSFDADIYCLQEVRANEQITRELFGDGQINLFDNNGDKCPKYFKIYNTGSVAGYAGTMILSKIKPNKVETSMGKYWSDVEGRTTTCYFDNFVVVNAYIPNGNSRLEFKMQYLEALTKYLKDLQKEYKVICVGDFNIAHNEIDLTNPKECKNKSVFLPMEREAFSKILDVGYIDCFRFLYPQKIEYTWRSYNSRKENFALQNRNSYKYRIDYAISSKGINVLECEIFDLEYSDHLPVILTFNAL